MERARHPVWTVYDELRTVRLNVKYYGARLRALERWNIAIEVVVALSTSSAVAGLGFWTTQSGTIIWEAIGGFAVILTIVKIPFSLTKRIKETEGVLSGYRALDLDLMELKLLIEQRQRFDTALQKQFNRTIERLRPLVARAPESRSNRKLVKKCEDEVLQELPSDSFYVPEAEDVASRETAAE